ncbi:hypothetical protein EPUS_06133 [Endocarpon pusillum Z07020]|uniref:Uncharacterized protein n=1 Tax=Endocarpon pusillum (strain Z07020 / HMAS-L-300199) TaxID=1263415 RepID=U1GWK2_ENDPU|nr:uncharacterized protein EPUS_06133 [Endocarpon pusillum Z07020]ERF76471.1 hypothetical protein EPUS_06133 [Endocarpon pusillum Z07020]
MQTILHARTQVLRQLGKSARRAPNNMQAARAYADIPKANQTTPLTRNNIPLIAAAALAAAIPSYYFIHSNKVPASGQSEIREARDKGDPSKEYRDPRDSDVKTLEDKKRKYGS